MEEQLDFRPIQITGGSGYRKVLAVSTLATACLAPIAAILVSLIVPDFVYFTMTIGFGVTLAALMIMWASSMHKGNKLSYGFGAAAVTVVAATISLSLMTFPGLDPKLLGDCQIAAVVCLLLLVGVITAVMWKHTDAGAKSKFLPSLTGLT